MKINVPEDVTSIIYGLRGQNINDDNVGWSGALTRDVRSASS